MYCENEKKIKFEEKFYKEHHISVNELNNNSLYIL